MHKLLFVGIVFFLPMVGAHTTTAQDDIAKVRLRPAELAALIKQSDKHFVSFGAGQIAQDDLKKWMAEAERIDMIIASLHSERPNLQQVTFYQRRGDAQTILSGGMGSDSAETAYVRAESVLNEVRTNHGLDDVLYVQVLITLLQMRAHNKALLKDVNGAFQLLNRALIFAQNCNHAGKLDEAAILEQFAGIHFRNQYWEKAREYAERAAKIMAPLNVQGRDKSVLRMALWHVAVAKTYINKNAEEDFLRLLALVGRDIAPRDEADVYFRMASNVGELGYNTVGEPRQVGLRKAQEYNQKAQQIIDTATAGEVEKKIAIYLDLGMDYASNGMGAEARMAFQEALNLGRGSVHIGENSLILIPILQNYAASLQRSGRDAEANGKLVEAERIAKLHENK